MSENENKAAEANEAIQDQTLEDLSGGYIYGPYGDEGPWEVIDDNDGSVVATYRSEEEALNAANALGYDDLDILWDDLDKLRKGEHIDI